MAQRGLFPEPIRRIVSNPVPSADSPGIGQAFSGQQYVLKCGAPYHAHLQASEWICHGLAQYLHLPVPQWAICTLPDGREAFGSRLEGLVTATRFVPVGRPATANPEVISRTFVLDLFVANNDRHVGNWLETEAGGQRLLRPIDYSRALFFRYPPLPTPAFDPGDNSDQFYSMARALGVVVKAEAEETHDRLSRMAKSDWRAIVESVPTGWLPDQVARELINWWWSPQWNTRVKWMEQQL